MHRLMLSSVVLPLAAATATAGPELVDYPEGYGRDFVLYDKIDKPERKIVRFMYVDPASDAAATAGEALPYGTVLVMEDHPVELDGEEPVLDAQGRLVPTDEIRNVFVMEKQPGWGAEYPEELRNGEWEYARFLADGNRLADAQFTGCFECHKGQAEEDYTFSFYTYLRQR